MIQCSAQQVVCCHDAVCVVFKGFRLGHMGVNNGPNKVVNPQWVEEVGAEILYKRGKGVVGLQQRIAVESDPIFYGGCRNEGSTVATCSVGSVLCFVK